MFYDQASGSQKACAIPPQEGKENRHPDHPWVGIIFPRLYEMYLPFNYKVEVEENRKEVRLANVWWYPCHVSSFSGKTEPISVIIFALCTVK